MLIKSSFWRSEIFQIISAKQKKSREKKRENKVELFFQ